MAKRKILSTREADVFITLLKRRFEENRARHKGIEWESVQERLGQNPARLFSLHEMEVTGGEPDLISWDQKTDEYLFVDCAPETPKGRRSLCYDEAARESRKEHKPKDSAWGMAMKMGVELLNEDQYRQLQKIGTFDTKTSSWLDTPPEVRALGGAIFGDFRYGRVFIYHNGAESYYAARGFRAMLRI